MHCVWLFTTRSTATTVTDRVYDAAGHCNNDNYQWLSCFYAHYCCCSPLLRFSQHDFLYDDDDYDYDYEKRCLDFVVMHDDTVIIRWEPWLGQPPG